MDNGTDVGRWAVSLESVDRASLALVGGKGANLGELIRAGFPVPPGFCVTTLAYARFVEAAALAPVVESALRGLDVEDPGVLARAGEQIRSAFVRAPIPGEIGAAIAAALARLGPDTPLAVRSSATAEDLPEASFAGQQDTYLNVVGLAALLDAVRRCWASLWTDRAIAYRQRNAVAHSQVRLACVVQRMVDADVAGVLFTANPLTGRRTELAIDASPGLGEAIVAGLVTPDHYVVRKPALADSSVPAEKAIIERRPGDRPLQVRSAPGGGTERVAVPPEERGRPALSDAQVLSLARMGCRIEAHFGSPQDVEWALAGGALAILQARPITSLFPLPPGDPEGELRVLLCLSAAQGLLEPLTPLGFSAFQETSRLIIGAFRHGRTPARSPLVPLAGRLYADVTPVVRTEVGRALLLTALAYVDPVARRAIEPVLADPRLAVRPGTGRGWLLRRLPGVFRAIWPVPARVVSSFLWPGRVQPRIDREALPALRQVADEAARPGNLAERVARVRTVVRRGGRVAVTHFAPLVVAGVASWQLVERLAARWRLDTRLILPLRQGVPNNPTTEMDLALWKVAVRVRGDPGASQELLRHSPDALARMYRDGSLPAPAQAALGEFVALYGHRAVREIDIGVPRWDEDPAYLLATIQGYLRHDPDVPTPDERFARLVAEAARAERELVAQARAQRLGWLKAALLRRLIYRMRALLGYREAPKFHAVWLLRLVRRLLLSVGADLVAAGDLEAPDDVFFLTYPELESRARAEGPVPELRRLVAERRRAYREEFGRHQIPRVVTSEGDAVYGRSAQSDGRVLAGAGVSPGVAEGRCRIVRDPATARLEPGEILVAPSTDPAWTPLFLTAGGLVMEAGGMMSHGAVVAREYGIPAVVGVPEATRLLRTGQRVTVDGSAGTVTLNETAWSNQYPRT